jgi:hypothetical protein
MKTTQKRTYTSFDGKKFETRAEFQTHRRKYFKQTMNTLIWMILDLPEAQDGTFAGKTSETEINRLFDQQVSSDPINKAFARKLRRLLDAIENGPAASEDTLPNVDDKL